METSVCYGCHFACGKGNRSCLAGLMSCAVSCLKCYLTVYMYIYKYNVRMKILNIFCHIKWYQEMNKKKLGKYMSNYVSVLNLLKLFLSEPIIWCLIVYVCMYIRVWESHKITNGDFTPDMIILYEQSECKFIPGSKACIFFFDTKHVTMYCVGLVYCNVLCGSVIWYAWWKDITCWF